MGSGSFYMNALVHAAKAVGFALSSGGGDGKRRRKVKASARREREECEEREEFDDICDVCDGRRRVPPVPGGEG